MIRRALALTVYKQPLYQLGIELSYVIDRCTKWKVPKRFKYLKRHLCARRPNDCPFHINYRCLWRKVRTHEPHARTQSRSHGQTKNIYRMQWFIFDQLTLLTQLGGAYVAIIKSYTYRMMAEKDHVVYCMGKVTERKREENFTIAKQNFASYLQTYRLRNCP